MAIKLEGGGKALVARPLVEELFFCGFPKQIRFFFLSHLPDWIFCDVEVAWFGVLRLELTGPLALEVGCVYDPRLQPQTKNKNLNI